MGQLKGSGIKPAPVPPTLTFGRARSTQPHLLPAALTDIRRGLNSRTIEPLAGSSSRRGLALGLSDFLKPQESS